MDRETALEWLKDMTDNDWSSLDPAVLEAMFPVIEQLIERQRADHVRMDSFFDRWHFYQAALDALPNPIFVKDEQLRFTFFNKRYKDFFALDDGQYIGMQVSDLPYLSPEDRIRYGNEDAQMRDTLSTISYEAIYDSSSDGTVESMYWSRGFSTPETGSRGVIGEIVDISKEKRLQRDLERRTELLEQVMDEIRLKSKLDPGTKLLNRHAMAEELPRVLESAMERRDTVCGLLCDVDHFKYINDTYGHTVGDDILARFADIMRRCFRSGDLTIRYGGDEFAAVLTGVGRELALDIAERFRSRVESELQLPGGEHVTTSIGVTQYIYGEDLITFMTRADEALYISKRSGRNRASAI